MSPDCRHSAQSWASVVRGEIVCEDCHREREEAETVKRIVAWLRSNIAANAWGEKTSSSIADAIEQGDWRNGGDNRG